MESAGWRASPAIRVAGVLALVVVLAVGVAVGTEARGGSGPNGVLAVPGGGSPPPSGDQAVRPPIDTG
jgi:hypothetical protein